MYSPFFTAYTAQIQHLNENVSQLNESEKMILKKNVGMTLVYSDVRLYLDNISKHNKKYIVMENDFCFEIMRVVDNCDLKKIYDILKPDCYPSLANAESIIVNLLQKYLNSDWTNIFKICSLAKYEMFNNCVVPYSWIQRNVSGISLFKKSGDPVELLNHTIKTLVTKNVLAIQDGSIYKTKAKIYKILIERKDLINELSDIEKANIIKRVKPKRNQLELDKQNQLAYITMEAEKLGVLTNKELEITSDIVVTFDDIKAHLDNLSKGPKRYAVAHDTNLNCFRIVRQMDNADLEVVFYMTKKYDPLTDPDRKPAQVDPRDLAERQERDRQDAEEAARMLKK